MEKLLTMQHISKSFTHNKVLDDVYFDLYGGEVHALIGENGAGKSTLMKILMGVYQADEGTVEVQGKLREFRHPSQALEAGIAMIHQELNPIPEMSVAENIFVGRELRRMGFVDRRSQEEKAKEYLNQLGVDIDPSSLMRDLSVSEVQMVEIAKTISYGARIVIMDEPTSAITETEVRKLFDCINYLREQGIGIIYISHKMDELFAISQRITVLRDGQYIDTKATCELTNGELISMMVGREINDIYPEHSNTPTQEILTVKGLTKAGDFQDISFSLMKGEKLGIAGLMGAGRTELVMSIFGAFSRDSGSVYIDGKEIEIHNPAQAIANGIALISEDRKLYGLNLAGSVMDNTVSVIEKAISYIGVIFPKRIANTKTRDMVKSLNIKAHSISQTVGSLSGGNQQKVVLAKWLLSEPEIIIFDEPTRGIDIGAKTEIYKLIDHLACAGKSIIIISSEMPELIGLSNRILVMHEGRITGELTGEQINQENIMTLASGITEGDGS